MGDDAVSGEYVESKSNAEDGLNKALSTHSQLSLVSSFNSSPLGTPVADATGPLHMPTGGAVPVAEAALLPAGSICDGAHDTCQEAVEGESEGFDLQQVEQ